MGSVSYLDAGSASVVAGAIAAGAAGVVVFLKNGLRRAGKVLPGRRQRPPAKPAE